MKSRAIYSFLLLGITLLHSCRSKNQYQSRPVKGASGSENELLEVSAVPYHENDSLTLVYMQISNENLLYKRPDTSRVFYTQLRVFYQLLGENSRRVIDSSSYYVLDMSVGEKVPVKFLYSEFGLAARRGNNYTLEFEIYDLNRRTRYSRGLVINKQSSFGAQNYLVKRNDTVVFRNHFLKGEHLRVTYSVPHTSSLTVECFLKESGPALPPFSTKEPDELKYKVDSTFIVSLSGNRFSLQMPGRGFCHVKADPNEPEGLSLFTYDENFPGVSNSDEMINCARYIMSKEEFDGCKSAEDKKAAIDKFWLGIGGSNERARELLKRYYGRVKEANKYYSSYTQGWKTDRGMIYIVFGQPANIYKSKKDEIWVYGNEANPAALRFVFNKTKNPYSENDYVMERSQFYKDPWYGAVDYWRQGHVYFDGRR